MKYLLLIIFSFHGIAFGQTSYRLISKEVVPADAQYPCEALANLTTTKTGYAFIYVGEYQKATNPGVYFSALNQGRMCYKNDTYGERCETATGSDHPLVLVKESCRTMLPIRCVEAQNRITLKEAEQDQLVLSYKNFQAGHVQEATCVYQKN